MRVLHQREILYSACILYRFSPVCDCQKPANVRQPHAAHANILVFMLPSRPPVANYLLNLVSNTLFPRALWQDPPRLVLIDSLGVGSSGIKFHHRHLRRPPLTSGLTTVKHGSISGIEIVQSCFCCAERTTFLPFNTPKQRQRRRRQPRHQCCAGWSQRWPAQSRQASPTRSCRERWGRCRH